MRGAWIETQGRQQAVPRRWRRPSCEGRGLKLALSRLCLAVPMRRPSCEGRGLKRHTRRGLPHARLRRPSCEGRGLKLSRHARDDVVRRRPSCEGRGLKHKWVMPAQGVCCRPSCEGRGLKHHEHDVTSEVEGSPLMRGAWIETVVLQRALLVSPVAPHARGVD